MAVTDRAFRALAIEQPEIIAALLELCAPDLLPPGTRLETDDVDAPSLVAPPTLEADWVARAGDGLVVHLESQGYRDSNFIDRLFRYHLGFVLRYPDREVRSVALWLERPPPGQHVERIHRQGVAVQVTSLVLRELSAVRLLERRETACFAAGADGRDWTDVELCRRVVRVLGRGATERERVLAIVLAATTGRYDAMMEAMKDAEMELPIIEDLVLFGEDRGRQRGKAAGKAEAVLSVLRARNLQVSPADEQRIASCGDEAQLDEWICLAATAESVAKLFV